MTPKRLLAFVLPVVLVAGVVFLVFGRQDSVSALEVPRTEDFPETLTQMGVFAGESMADLAPADGYHLLELESSLFVDGSDKQRLISLPEGSVITVDGSGLPVFPEGTTLVKTFFYPLDERDPDLGRRILETRFLILTNGEWNVATYVWNDEQTEATILLDGAETTVEWTDSDGIAQSIDYQIPNENQCVSCHQQSEVVAPIGPKLRNLNFDVERNDETVNQLEHFQSVGIVGDVDPASLESMVDYFDESLPISERGRAYLDMNCAHCHNPEAWERPADQGFDLAWESTETAPPNDQLLTRLTRQVRGGNMPFFGTTIVDDEGLAILEEYLDE